MLRYANTCSMVMDICMDKRTAILFFSENLDNIVCIDGKCVYSFILWSFCLEKPTAPVLETTFDADKFYIEFKTGSDAPDVPRKFFIQYKKADDSEWREVDKAFDDTLPGQESKTCSYGFIKSNLDPDTEYEVRIKSVDDNGLVSYSARSSFRTDS